MRTPDELIPLAESGDDAALEELCALSADPDLLVRFASSPLRALQLRAVEHEDTPPEALLTLAGIEDLSLRMSLLGRPHLGVAILERLADSPPLVELILPRDDCPVALLEAAAESNEAVLQLIVAEHVRTPGATLDALVRKAVDPRVEAALWARGEHDLDRLPAFAEALSPELRTGVARHPEAPPAIVKRLAHDTDDDVRAAVAARADLPPALAMLLADDHAPEVTGAVQRHPIIRHKRRRKQIMGAGLLMVVGGVGVGCLMVIAFVWAAYTLLT